MFENKEKKWFFCNHFYFTFLLDSESCSFSTFMETNVKRKTGSLDTVNFTKNGPKKKLIKCQWKHKEKHIFHDYYILHNEKQKQNCTIHLIETRNNEEKKISCYLRPK